MTDPKVERIAGGVYRVEQDGRQETVYVAGTGQDRWAHWNGHVFHEVLAAEPSDRPAARGRGAAIAQPLTAPMPATVIKILVAPGAAVKKGVSVLNESEGMGKKEVGRRQKAEGSKAVRDRHWFLIGSLQCPHFTA